MAIGTGTSLNYNYGLLIGYLERYNNDQEFRKQVDKNGRKRKREEQDRKRAEIQMWLDIYQPGVKADLRKHWLPEED